MASNFETYGVDQVVHINHGDYSAVLAPNGASLKTLDFKGVPMAVVPQPVTDFTFAGSALAPWANRLEDARWELDGTLYQGEITEAKNHNGLHGLVVRQDFAVVAQAADSVTFRYEFGSDPVYPFAVVFEVSYRVTDAGLHVTMAATNRADRDVPISIGTHPYYAIDDSSQLKVSARKATVNSSRQLPFGEQAVEAVGLAHGDFVNLANLELDDCLFELGSQPETVISRPALSREVVIWQDRSMPYVMVFVRGPKFSGGTPTTVAVEPQTSKANALATKEDLVWLTPGETRAFTWGVRVR